MIALRTDRPAAPPEHPPRLDSGDRMDSATFMATYGQTPEGSAPSRSAGS